MSAETENLCDYCSPCCW